MKAFATSARPCLRAQHVSTANRWTHQIPCLKFSTTKLNPLDPMHSLIFTPAFSLSRFTGQQPQKDSKYLMVFRNLWQTYTGPSQVGDVITRASFCCSKKVRKLHLFSRKVALCAHLTAKDMTQPIFVCADLTKSQDFPHFHIQLSSRTVVLGWGCKTASLQTKCFVIDNIETQLIRHIALFHAIKEYRTKLK